MAQFTGFWWGRNNSCQLLGIFPTMWNYSVNDNITATELSLLSSPSSLLLPPPHGYCYDYDYNHYYHKKRLGGRINFRKKGWGTDSLINAGIYLQLVSIYIRLRYFPGTKKWCYDWLNVFPNQLIDFLKYRKRGTHTIIYSY